VPASAGTLETHKPLFAFMLVGVIIILVGLTYFPALALGPFAEGLH
jgi:K+-transporting ATPase ATPase A chain